MSVISPTDKLIRKLRKKLRQIENLEFLGRSNLNEEELLKVSYTCQLFLSSVSVFIVVFSNVRSNKKMPLELNLLKF
jgi:hypothetical protein